jgi:hypothetical protein
MHFFQLRDISALGVAILLLCITPLHAIAEPGINLNHELALGECANTLMDGQQVRVCRDKLGTYKILPLDTKVSVADPRQSPELPKIICGDVIDGHENGKIEELQKRAKLAYWSRYHDYIIGGLCREELSDLDSMVDNGYLSTADVQSVANILNKTYAPIPCGGGTR